ncbi:hypothetical protein POD33_12080 [Streptomyces moderatus]|nr:hypothetical protein POD33_12080 [Streptomyces moderatus]
MSGSGDEGCVSGDERLPEGWAWATVGEVGEIDLGRQRHPDWHHGPEMRPYLRVANVFEDRIDTADLKEMDFSGVFDRYRLVPGDVLLNEGQSPHLVGRPALYRGDPAEIAFTNSLIRFRAGTGLLPEWALLVFRRHMHFGRFMREARITTNLAHLSAVRLKAVEFPVPPTAEQRRIVDVFAARVARLDSIECTLRHAQTTLERLETVVMATASTGLLGSSGPSVPADPPPALGVIDGALPDTAPGWTWARLDEIAAVVSGVAKDSKKQDDSGLPEVPYLRAANAQRAQLDLSHVTRIRVPDKTLDKLRLRAGDVLMTEGGDRDKLGRGWIWEDQIEDCIHQNHLFRARVQEGATHPKLLSWYVNSAARRWFEVNGKQSVNLASISMSKVRKLPVPIPPSDPSNVQEEAVAVGERALRHMAVLSSRCREGIRHVADLRRALLSEAFSGRLVPQNPDDEPAEVLLKRIRVEREVAEAERKAARRAARTKARQALAPAPPPHRDTPALDGEQTALPLEFSS